ncbi:F-box domain - like 10 [Theobroma cacao]|nr:F-box domain - like 10 [Theobroma cacao]
MRKGDTVHPPWEELPHDIWGFIFQRLPLVDRVHASVVCKQWSSALKQTPRPAWILLHLDDDTQYCHHMIMSYFDFGEGAIKYLNLPESIPKGAATGASRGWLRVRTEDTTTDNPQIFLLDPISGVQLPLPPMSTIRSASEDTNIIFPKIEISSQDASQSVVAAVFDDGKSLALCNPKDKRWTVFEGLDIADNYSYTCITFCNGILYALIIIENDATILQTRTHSIKLAGGDHHVILKLIPFSKSEISSPIFLECPLGKLDSFGNNWAVIPYLVDSNNELLLVVKILDDKVDEGDQEDEPQIPYYRVATFRAFKVEASDTVCLKRLSSLEDQTLFIDGMDIVSLPCESFSKHCIYFLEESSVYADESRKATTYPQSGVFYLNDGRIEHSFPCGDITRRRNFSWFFPNIKIGGFN